MGFLLRNHRKIYNSVYLFELKKVLSEANIDPFNSWLDLDFPITRKEVLVYVKNNPSIDERKREWQIDWDCRFKESFRRQEHIQRIAYFVVHDIVDPIELDTCCDHVIVDGHHRLCAAMMKKQKTVDIEMAGDVSLLKKWFKKSLKDGLCQL